MRGRYGCKGNEGEVDKESNEGKIKGRERGVISSTKGDEKMGNEGRKWVKGDRY